MGVSTIRIERRLWDFLGPLYACRDTAGLANWVIRELPRLVDADQVIFNYLDLSTQNGWFVARPELDDLAGSSRLFLRHMHEHPKIHHYLMTGDLSAGAISDFMSARRYHQTALYNELYRDLGYEDHLGILLAPPGKVVIGIGLGRGSPSFTTRDHQILDLLRPHIARAWRNAKAYTQLARRCRQHSNGAWSVDEFGLTARECQILREVEQGKANHEIAHDLFISVATVKKHLEHAYAKLEVKSRSAALARLRGLSGRPLIEKTP